MTLCEFTEALYVKLSEELEAVSTGETGMRSSEKSVSVVYDYIQQLKEFIKTYSFVGVTEEIQFFKEIKPKFTSLLIYHMGVYNIETERPLGMGKMLKEYYQKEVEKLEYYFQDNFDFHKYYRSSATHLDEKYFLRGNFDIHLAKGAFFLDLDPSFSTLCDYKISRIMANEKLVSYLQKAIGNLELQENGLTKQAEVTKCHLSWTASKTDLIELLYGFYCIGAFNNGSMELNKIVTFFETLFGTELGNYSRFFQQMRIRKKNRTSFIDKIKEKLIDHMDELDDQFDNKPTGSRFS